MCNTVVIRTGRWMWHMVTKACLDPIWINIFQPLYIFHRPGPQLGFGSSLSLYFTESSPNASLKNWLVSCLGAARPAGLCSALS